MTVGGEYEFRVQCPDSDKESCESGYHSGGWNNGVALNDPYRNAVRMVTGIGK